MKISLKWLNDFVDVSDYFAKPDGLGDILTRAGLEVEEITDKAKDFQFVVVGLILEKDKHPNADKLSLCKVATGEGVVHQIVCGAQNHKANDKVIVALPGAVLPGNFAIKKSAVRGVESGGMLCSYKELGMAGDSEGIAILPDSAPIGAAYAEYSGADDIVFELKVTPNRADCLSHFGLAREVACLLSRPLKNFEIGFAESSLSTRKKMNLEVQEPSLCPRYAGRYISGVKVGPSPDWLKNRLESVGLASINNVVDVTNYVMMELGQPLHAFDARFLSGQKIIVGKANAGESFVSLDGTEYKMHGEELMIRDGEKPVALAGVVGGKNSGVLDDTQDIFLESAYFQPMTVRKSGRVHGIETDSAYRFSRGVDPSNTLQAMNRATHLILKVAGGEAAAEPWDFYPAPHQPTAISITIKTVSDRLGYEAKTDLFIDYIKRLGCLIEQKGEVFVVTPPTFRFDLECDMDLVEEYARIFGYDSIPETIPALASVPGVQDKAYMLSHQMSYNLRAQGFSQAMNFAFVGEKAQADLVGDRSQFGFWGLDISATPIRLMNPLSDETNIMRSTLLVGLLKNVATNFHYGNHEGRLYEAGSTFNLKDAGEYIEGQHLGLAAWGHQAQLWNKDPQHALVFEIKSAMEVLLKNWGITAFSWVQPENKGEIPRLAHRGQFAGLVVEGKKVGFIATVHPSWTEDQKVRVPVAVGEFDLAPLFKTQPRPYKINSLSRFPGVERDYAFVMPKSVKVQDVMTSMKKVAGGLAQSISVFDVYEGDKMEIGKKSVAFRLLLQDQNGTLQEQVITDLHNKLIETLQKQFSITVR
jgi:phenylalanyl-tRNA synthetase beta chain